jgi:tRNA (cmo5U34)-methyltransferase
MQFHFTPERYLALMRDAIPDYDEFEDEVATATTAASGARILDLGTGTGETARRVLELRPSARLTALDASAEMLELAKAVLPGHRVDRYVVGGLTDALPAGPFDVVVSALAVHHLEGASKADLFRRIASALVPSGRFVMGDVVVPDDPDDAVTPVSPEHDRPDRPAALMGWLRDAGFEPDVVWSRRDLAVFAADLRG